MRCKDVEQWMNEESGKLSPAMAEHIAQCPSCARAIESERSLSELLHDFVTEDQIVSFAEIRERVLAARARLTIREKIMSYINDQIQTRPRLLAGAGVAVVTFLFVMLVPFSFTHTAGYQVSVTGVEPADTTRMDLVDQILARTDIENMSLIVTHGDSGIEYTIADIPDKDQADRVVQVVSDLTDARVELVVSPVVKKVSAPLYSQVVKRVTRAKAGPPKVLLDFEGVTVDEPQIITILQDSDMTDAEAGDRLREILTESGLDLDDLSVTTETDAEGKKRSLRLHMSGGKYEEDDDKAEVEIYYGERDIGIRYDTYVLTVKGDTAIQMDFPPDKSLTSHSVVITVRLRKKVGH